MQLPVDIKALLNEATDIKAARETPIAVSVYIDEDAPSDLVGHVRNAFASTLPTVRLTLTYLNDNFIPQPTDDIAIIVAGVSDRIGRDAAAIRDVGVPVMVVTTVPHAVALLAKEEGTPIPDGDLIYPHLPKKKSEEPSEQVDPAAEAIMLVEQDGLETRPIALDEAAAADLDERMGRWIVSVCRSKRLTYAIAFPFVRRPLAKDAIQATSLQNAGIGLIPIIPGADLPIMTLNQAKMVLQISAAYGHDMTRGRIKELAAVIANAYLCRTLTRQLVEFIPVLGFVLRPGVAYGGTTALGYALIEYFEGGENVTGLANVVDKAFTKGKKVVTKAASLAAKVLPGDTSSRA